jgi:hypothetical protein
MALLISSAVLFLLAHFLTSAGVNSPQRRPAEPKRETLTPEWSTNIRVVIGALPVGGGNVHEYEYKTKASLWFTDNRTVVATFVTREGGDKPRLSRRGVSDESLPLRLRAVLLDATSGKVKATTDWPAESRSARIVAARDGKFVTQTGNELTLYPSDLKELKKLRLPPTEEFGWGGHPQVQMPLGVVTRHDLVLSIV